MTTCTTPSAVRVTFPGLPPVVIPRASLDGLSCQRAEAAVEAHLREHGHRPRALDIATPKGRPASIAVVTEQGVLTGTITSW